MSSKYFFSSFSLILDILKFLIKKIKNQVENAVFVRLIIYSFITIYKIIPIFSLFIGCDLKCASVAIGVWIIICNNLYQLNSKENNNFLTLRVLVKFCCAFYLGLLFHM